MISKANSIVKTDSGIISINCPMCKKSPLLEYYEKNEIIHGKLKITKVYWRCPNCVHNWPIEWFDVFTHFEKFVRRKYDESVNRS